MNRLAFLLAVLLAGPLFADDTPSANGLVGFWSFEEGAGMSTANSFTNAYNGALSNAVNWTTGRVGDYGLAFPTDHNGFVYIADDLGLQNLTNLTVSVWFRTMGVTGSVSSCYLVSKTKLSANGWAFYISSPNSTRTLAFTADFATTNLVVSAPAKSVPFDGLWHHAAMTWDGSINAASVSFYVDGAPVGYASSQDGAGSRLSDATQPLTFGNAKGGSRPFEGSLDAVRLYNRVLTSDEVKILSEEGAPPAPAISSLSITPSIFTCAVAWDTTNLTADSSVCYGTNDSSICATNTDLVISHYIVLSNLSAMTAYQFSASSRTAANGYAVTNGIFTTLADTNGPLISVTTIVGATKAKLSWTTSRPAISVFDYGLTAGYGQSLTQQFASSFNVVIKGLTNSTLYYFRILDTDTNGLSSATSNTFTTAATGVFMCGDTNCVELAPEDVWVICGDSITGQGGYSDYLESYYQLRYPLLHPHIRGCSRSGGQLSELLDSVNSNECRYSKQVWPLFPDIVSVEMTTNGGDDANTFKGEYSDLVTNYIIGWSAADVIVFGLVPSYDQVDGGLIPRARTAVAMDLAKAGGWPYADSYNLLMPFWSTNRSLFAQTGNPADLYRFADLQETTRWHPGPAGHLALTWAYLTGIHAEHEVSAVTLDGTSGQILSTNRALVSDVSVTSSNLSFVRLDDRLPMAWDDPAWTIITNSVAASMVPVLDFNRYMLTVTNLPDGNYDVWIGTNSEMSSLEYVTTLTSTVFSVGWNMTSLQQGPIHRQLMRVLDRIREKQGNNPVAVPITDPSNTSQDWLDRTAIVPHQGMQIWFSEEVLNFTKAGLRSNAYAAAMAPYRAQVASNDWYSDVQIWQEAQPQARRFSLQRSTGGSSSAPVANFVGNPVSGATPLAVTFNDTSTGNITGRSWDFGDGDTTNITTNVVYHTYCPGTYQVTLVVAGPGGVSTNTEAGYITAYTAYQSWQILYFGSTTNPRAAPEMDADGTGQNNLFKYVTGLDPTNPASVFSQQVAPQIGQPNWQNLLYKPEVAGRTYTPLFSTDLVSRVWMPLTTYAGPVTNGNQVTITDTNALPPQKFYRLQISQQ